MSKSLNSVLIALILLGGQILQSSAAGIETSNTANAKSPQQVYQATHHRYAPKTTANEDTNLYNSVDNKKF